LIKLLFWFKSVNGVWIWSGWGNLQVLGKSRVALLRSVWSEKETMVGGGSRRDEGSLMLNNTNVFAALDTLKKKKKSDKEKSKGKGSSTKSQGQSTKTEAQVFWAPAPLNAKSWADVDDDDDYYATTAPPQSGWGISETHHSKDDKHGNFEVRLFICCFVYYLFHCVVWMDGSTCNGSLEFDWLLLLLQDILVFRFCGWYVGRSLTEFTMVKLEFEIFCCDY